ncbi:MAG: T9SS type A sorting domain-containing protein [Fidelibacterota bacterium]
MKKLLTVVLIAVLAIPAFAQITPIRDIQYTTEASGDSPMNGQTVTISGIVTAEPYAYGNSYFFVQDDNAPWSGIFVYDSAPDDILIAEGDSVTLTGTIEEKYGMTRFTDLTSIVIEEKGVFGIEPIVVTADQIATGAAESESYEAVLVQIRDVAVANPDEGYGEWSVTDGTDTVMVDNGDYYFWPAEYDSIKSITGPLHYDYNNRKIAPRIAYDIVEGVKKGQDKAYTRIQRIQQVRYSDLVKAGVDAESDISYLVREPGDSSLMTVRGIVTMPTGISYAGDGIKFILSDPHGGPWSAILSYNADSTIYPVLFPGDEIEMTGYVGEYTTYDANMTEFWLVGDIEILNFEQALPDTPVVKTGDLRWPTTAEQWGNVFVKTENCVVTNNDLQYEVMEIDDGSGAALVDDDSDSLANYIAPPVGTQLQSVVGWIYHHYGSYADSTTYKIEPLFERDIVAGEGPALLTSAKRTPQLPSSSDVVTVQVTAVTNRSITDAKVYYRVDNAASYTEVVMTDQGEKVFAGDIPAQAEGAFVDYYFYVEDEKGGVSTLPSDVNLKNFSYVVTDGNPTIRDIQYTHWANGESPFHGSTVTTTGYITAGQGYVTQFTNSGVSALPMADDSGPWNGIFILATPEQLAGLQYGQEVTVTGRVDDNYDEYWRWQKNTYIVADSIVAGDVSEPPTPARVSISDIAADHESFEGVEINVTDFSQIASINQYDITITNGSDSILLDDDCVPSEIFSITSNEYAVIGATDTVRVGDYLDIVKGVYLFSYGTFKIEVRDGTDLGLTSATEPVVPMTYALHQNYPNPFNPSTSISFSLPEQTLVSIQIYNVRGQLVQTLTNSVYAPGQHTLTWKPVNLSSGIYLYRINAGDFNAVKKMTYLK